MVMVVVDVFLIVTIIQVVHAARVARLLEVGRPFGRSDSNWGFRAGKSDRRGNE